MRDQKFFHLREEQGEKRELEDSRCTFQQYQIASKTIKTAGFLFLFAKQTRKLQAAKINPANFISLPRKPLNVTTRIDLAGKSSLQDLAKGRKNAARLVLRGLKRRKRYLETQRRWLVSKIGGQCGVMSKLEFGQGRATPGRVHLAGRGFYRTKSNATISIRHKVDRRVPENWGIRGKRGASGISRLRDSFPMRLPRRTLECWIFVRALETTPLFPVIRCARNRTAVRISFHVVRFQAIVKLAPKYDQSDRRRYIPFAEDIRRSCSLAVNYRRDKMATRFTISMFRVAKRRVQISRRRSRENSSKED